MVCNLNAIVLDRLASQTCDDPFVFPPEDEASHSRTITIQIRTPYFNSVYIWRISRQSRVITDTNYESW